MPSTIEAVVILILFIAPGFLCARMVRAEIPSALGSDRQFLVLAIIFSLLVHVVLLVYTIEMAPKLNEFFQQLRSIGVHGKLTLGWSVLVWLVIVLFVGPIAIASVLSWVWRSDFAQPLLEKFGISVVQLTPTAWDWFFLTQKDGCWLVAELDDGSIVGGEFGSGSFASLTPHRADIFVEREYYVDENHNFADPIPDNIGVWIQGEKVRHLHFYRVSEG